MGVLRYTQSWVSALEFDKLDTSFHYKIFQGNQRENVWAAITRLGMHYNRMNMLSEMEHHFEQAVTQHQNIITIIENKQVDQVEGVLRAHIMELINFWRELYNKESMYINYFDFT